MSETGLKTDLARLIDGEVVETPAALAEASGDYGGVICKSPRVVVHPKTTNDVARVVKYAYERDLPISPRAGGYSFAGQALNEGGVVIDMRGLCGIGPIHPQKGWIEAQAGTQWKDIVATTLPYERIPPVLPSYLRTSVGGTLSAAGFGFSSFRYGTQVDHSLELEVVNYNGEIVRCSQSKNEKLFEHALCGFGQFGIITSAQLRIRPVLPQVRTYFLQYDDLDAHLADQMRLVEERRVHFIDGMMRPCYHGHRVVNGRRERFHSFLYPLNITVESENTDDIDDAQILADLNFSKWIYAEDLSISDFILLGHTQEQRFSSNVAEVFTDVLLPWSALPSFIPKMQTHIYPNIIHVEHTVLWPMTLETITRPMLKLPKERLIMGIGLYSRVPKSYAQQTVAITRGYVDLAMRMGGTYYLTGSVRLDARRFAEQFGDEWASVRDVKKSYDPKGLFNPGFFQWSDP